MAKRTSKVIANVEFANVHKDRTSKIFVNVEYANVHRCRTSQFMVMVEYSPKEYSGRVYGPAVQ